MEPGDIGKLYGIFGQAYSIEPIGLKFLLIFFGFNSLQIAL